MEKQKVAILLIIDDEKTEEDTEPLKKVFEENNIDVVYISHVPSMRNMISEEVFSLVGKGVDLIVTIGGLGLKSKDITPEAIDSILDRRIQGLEILTFFEFIKEFPDIVLFRILVGVIRESLIICLPENMKETAKIMTKILPSLKKVIEELKN